MRSTDRHWSAWGATWPSPGRPSPAVGPSGSPPSRRPPRTPWTRSSRSIAAGWPAPPPAPDVGWQETGASTTSSTRGRVTPSPRRGRSSPRRGTAASTPTWSRLPPWCGVSQDSTALPPSARPSASCVPTARSSTSTAGPRTPRRELAVNSTAFWYATRASGLMALVLLTVTMVLGITTTSRARARNWPGFAQQEMHRRISILTMVFLGIHVLTSVLDTYVNIGWAAVVVPFTSEYSRFWVGVGAVGVDLVLAVFVSSLLRSRMNAGAWRALHWLAYLCWPVALAHTFGMGTDAGEAWVIGLGVVCVAAVAVGSRLATAGDGPAGLDPHRARHGPGRPAQAAGARSPPEVGTPCLTRAKPCPRSGATGCWDTRATWPATWPPSARCHLPPVATAPGARASSPRSRLRASPDAAAPTSRRPSSWPSPTPAAVGARSWSTAWRASRPATRTSCFCCATRTSFSTAPSCSRPPARRRG